MENIYFYTKVIFGLIFSFRIFFHIREGRLEQKGFIALWVPPDSPNRFRKNIRMAYQHYFGALLYIIQYTVILTFLSQYDWLSFVTVSIFSFFVLNWFFPIWQIRKYTIWSKKYPYQ